jgi:hypothetical protein
MAASHSLEDAEPIGTHLQCHIFALVTLPYHGGYYDCRLSYDRIELLLCKRGGMRAPRFECAYVTVAVLGRGHNARQDIVRGTSSFQSSFSSNCRP